MSMLRHRVLFFDRRDLSRSSPATGDRELVVGFWGGSRLFLLVTTRGRFWVAVREVHVTEHVLCDIFGGVTLVDHPLTERHLTRQFDLHHILVTTYKITTSS